MDMMLLKKNGLIKNYFRRLVLRQDAPSRPDLSSEKSEFRINRKFLNQLTPWIFKGFLSASLVQGSLIWQLLLFQPTGNASPLSPAQTTPINSQGPTLEASSSQGTPEGKTRKKQVNQGFLTHKEITELAQPRVRIGLRMTTFIKKNTKDAQGKSREAYVAREPMRHTLRARLNKQNHFYFGKWHVETIPLKWIRETRSYEIRLSFYLRYGAYDLLEESVGHIDLRGTLEEQEPSLFVLRGVARQRLRDKFGFPLVDVVAGYEPNDPNEPNPTIPGQTSETSKRSAPTVHSPPSKPLHTGKG